MSPRHFTLFLLSLCLVRAPAAEIPHAQFDEKQRVFFQDYCVECHNAEKHKGKLRLDDISFSIETVEAADRWQKILNELNSGRSRPMKQRSSRNAAARPNSWINFRARL